MHEVKIAIRVVRPGQVGEVRAFLKETPSLHDTSELVGIHTDEKNDARLIIIGNHELLDALRKTGYEVRVVIDYSKERDPREFISKSNRFEGELSRLRNRNRG